MMIKAVLALSLLFVSPFIIAQHSSSTFDRSAFYSAMSSTRIDVINAQAALLKNASFATKEAFEGAILMRKAGLVSKTSEKMSLFKDGHKKLDGAISLDITNPELRFLRLMIQENAPNVVKYRGDIENDSDFLKENFRQMPAEAQKALRDYAKVSKVLTPSDF